MITTEADITRLVRSDNEMMSALRIARDINLPNWWIGAGFLRNKVWDTMANVTGYDASDIDLVYFNEDNVSPEADWEYDAHLRLKDPQNNWEVRNQARMHYVNGFAPFSSTEDGIAHWTETATAVGVKLEGDELRFYFAMVPRIF